MRIEKHLADAYQAQAMEIYSPKELDARIRRLYEEQAQRERKVSMGTKKNRIVIFALVGLIALMITGFTVQYMMKLGDNRISLEYYASEVSYDPAIASVVRGQIQQVKEQLEVGEVAYVYSKEIAELTPNLSDDLPYAEYVSNPNAVEDYEVWKATLSGKKLIYKLPDTGSGHLSFIGGIEGRPFGGLVNQLDVASELQNKVKLSGGELAWEKVESNHEMFPVFTSLYEDEFQEVVSVMMEPVTENMNQVIMSEASHEKVMIHGQEANYTEVNKFLYSDTGHYQSLVWVETLDEMSIVYTIGSTGEQMTKERLIAIGESME